MRPVAALAAFALLAFLFACSALSTAPTPRWVEADVDAPSEQLLREVLVLSLEKAGYPVGAGVDPAQRSIQTGWQNSLHAFKGKGWRQRATAQYTSKGSDRFHVRLRVERETNESLRPLDPTHADWKPAPDQPDHAQIVMQYIRSTLGGGDFDVGEGERSRFGG